MKFKKLVVLCVFFTLIFGVGSGLFAQIWEDPNGWSGRRWLQWMGVSEEPEPGDPGFPCEYYCDDWEEWLLDIIWEPFLGYYSLFKEVSPHTFTYAGSAYATDNYFFLDFNNGEWFIFRRSTPPSTTKQLVAGSGKVKNPNTGVVNIDVKALLFLE